MTIGASTNDGTLWSDHTEEADAVRPAVVPEGSQDTETDADHGDDGYRAKRQLRADRQALPIISLTPDPLDERSPEVALYRVPDSRRTARRAAGRAILVAEALVDSSLDQFSPMIRRTGSPGP